jgi:hypothetical protein
VAQADAPTGEPKVVGVEIGRGDLQRRLLVGDHPVRDLLEGRHAERRSGSKLDLTLGHIDLRD